MGFSKLLYPVMLLFCCFFILICEKLILFKAAGDLRICHCSVCTLLCINSCTKICTLTFRFLMGQILLPFATLCSPLRTSSSVSQITSHAQFQIHLLGQLFVTWLCSSKLIIDCCLKCSMICTHICIIDSAGIALYACFK